MKSIANSLNTGALSPNEIISSLNGERKKQTLICKFNCATSYVDLLDIHPSLHPGEEQDAQEFLTFLMECLEKKMTPR